MNSKGNVILESDLVGNVECVDGLTKTLFLLCPTPCAGVWDVFQCIFVGNKCVRDWEKVLQLLNYHI